MKKFVNLILVVSILFLTVGCSNKNEIPINSSKENVDTTPEASPVIEVKKDEYKDILISAIGDCTLGIDSKFSYASSLPAYADKNGYSYFFEKVRDVLNKDDLTIANMEGPLTNATIKQEKAFAFKGDKEYTQILTNGSVEAVTLANNHSMDYLEEGYQDTKDNLDDAGIQHFGFSEYAIYEVKGIKIGLVGIQELGTDYSKGEIDKAVKYFNENPVDLIIYSFHWGLELDYTQNKNQEEIAHYAIDHGKASLVLGHHPHVLQGMETYKGVNIAYSLSNFCFGGNSNPKDKSTMILQIKFRFKNDEVIDTKITIIPAFISSQKNVNNYQPMIATGNDATNILNKIKSLSKNFSYEW